MSPIGIGAGKWSTACAIFLSTAALALAAPASADDADDAFIDGLDQGGITMPDNDDAIAKAQNVCTSLDANANPSALAIGLARQYKLSLKQAGYFVGLSVATYCPEHRDDVAP